MKTQAIFDGSSIEGFQIDGFEKTVSFVGEIEFASKIDYFTGELDDNTILPEFQDDEDWIELKIYGTFADEQPDDNQVAFTAGLKVDDSDMYSGKGVIQKFHNFKTGAKIAVPDYKKGGFFKAYASFKWKEQAD